MSEVWMEQLIVGKLRPGLFRLGSIRHGIQRDDPREHWKTTGYEVIDLNDRMFLLKSGSGNLWIIYKEGK